MSESPWRVFLARLTMIFRQRSWPIKLPTRRRTGSGRPPYRESARTTGRVARRDGLEHHRQDPRCRCEGRNSWHGPGYPEPPEPQAASRQPPPASGRRWPICARISIGRSPTSASRPSRTCRSARSNAGSAPPSISRRRDSCASFGCALRVARSLYTDESLSERNRVELRLRRSKPLSREFRRQFGRTPREYREHYRQL